MIGGLWDLVSTMDDDDKRVGVGYGAKTVLSPVLTYELGSGLGSRRLESGMIQSLSHDSILHLA